MVKTFGYILLITSLVIWALIFIIPFMDYTGGKKAGIMTILIIAGEATFYMGILLLGKTIYQKIKDKLRFWKKTPDGGVTDNNEKTGLNE